MTESLARLMLQSGDEVEFLYYGPEGDWCWGERSVLTQVYPRYVMANTIVPHGDREYLTTAGTTGGPLRVLGRWTLEQVARAIADGHDFDYAETLEAHGPDFTKPPQEYTFSWPEGFDSSEAS